MGVHGYIYAYAAIVAFATEQFSKMWNNPNSKFRRKYNKAPNLSVLLRNELAELKDALKELSEIKGFKHLHVADPALWDDLLQVVRVARNFYLHPKPDPKEFSHIVGLTHTKKTFSYPSDVASKVISYYISSMGFVVPDWVYNSTEFRIQSVEAIKLQEKL